MSADPLMAFDNPREFRRNMAHERCPGAGVKPIASIAGVFGAPPRDLCNRPDGAMQFSPLVPGGADLASLEPGTLSSLAMLAPPGTLERRYTMALGLRALAAGAPLTILAPKDKGGARIANELEALGCEVIEASKSHHRICTSTRPAEDHGLDQAIAEGGPQIVPEHGLWSEPGIFSWDRVDAGSALLVAGMPPLAGRGADFGCGYGVLARAILVSPEVTELILVDIDRRAVSAARRNVEDARARFWWEDVRRAKIDAGSLDFVVMNPPFHDGGAEDKALGQAFILRAGEILRKGGVCWLVANRHLPYEAVLRSAFASVALKAERGGYKVLEAVK